MEEESDQEDYANAEVETVTGDANASADAGAGANAGVSGGYSAGGRMGRWTSFAPLLFNKHWLNYVTQPGIGGELYARNTLVFAGEKDTGRLLMLYPSGVLGRPMPKIRSQGRDGHNTSTGAAPCHGQPRLFDIVAARPMLNVKRPDNAKFQDVSPSARQLHERMATAAVESLLVLAALNLAPRPGEEASPESSAAAEASLLGAALHKTAHYTWGIFAEAASWAEAIRRLARIKGYYRSDFPCLNHFDADEFLESGSIRRGEASSAPVPATGVPQLGLLVDLDENDGIVMIGLERLVHATERLRAYVLGARRGADDSYQLQSRGRRGE